MNECSIYVALGSRPDQYGPGNNFPLQIWLANLVNKQTNVSNKILYISMKENCNTKDTSCIAVI